MLYSLRKKIKLEDLSEIVEVSSIIPGDGFRAEEAEGCFHKEFMASAAEGESQKYAGVMEKDIAAFIDPRKKELGIRIISPKGAIEVDE